MSSSTPDKSERTINRSIFGAFIISVATPCDRDWETIYHFANAFAFVNSLPHNLEHPEMPRSMKFRDSPLIFPFVLYGDKFDLGKAEVGQIRDMTDLIVRMSKEMVGEIPEGGVQRDLTQAEQFEIVTGKQMGILRGYP